MPAIAVAVFLVFWTGVTLIGLRVNGGWCCLWRLRIGKRTTCRGKAWSELLPIEKSWFYQVPIGLAAAVALLVVGLTDILT